VRSNPDKETQVAEASKSTDDSTAQATGPSTETPTESSADKSSESSNDAPSTKTGTSQPEPDTRARGAAAPPERKKSRSAGAAVKAGTDAVRARIASLIWLLAVICALFLAVGALLVALKANQDNSIVQVVLKGAEKLDGPFSRSNGIFTFKGHDAATKAALVNWGIAAVIYLVIGRILDRLIRPSR
jgi:hypothetical protein